jgi:hypothetical protein
MTSPTSDKRNTKTDSQVIKEAENSISIYTAERQRINQIFDLGSKLRGAEGAAASARFRIKTLTAQKKTARAALNQAMYPTLGTPDPKIVQKALDYLNKTIADLATANADLKRYTDLVALYTAQIARVQKEKKYIDFSKTNQPKKQDTPPGNASSKKPPAENKPNKPLYKYNAPMTRSAYMGGSLQADMTGNSGLISGPGNRKDAKYNWIANKDTGKIGGSKGTVQMSRAFADLAPRPATGKNGQIVDSQLYGFKFLYNPTTVSMAWGIVEQFSPQFEASGTDKASAVSVGLMKSAVTFSLMLNRIDDMNFLLPDGSMIIDAEDSTADDGSFDVIYPFDFPATETKEIYKKGTMYDLEYLFKATGGYSASYNSVLNGKTADKGWLNPIPVELHLGDGMRYLVRLSSLDVNHMIFNERMVPTLTTVNLTFTRYFDGPEMYQNSTDAFGISPQSNNEIIK